MATRDNHDAIPHKVWTGTIPLSIQLAAADAVTLLASAKLPDPFQTFYTLAPRTSYLPFVSTQVKQQWIDPMLMLSNPRFRADEPAVTESAFWYEYNGVPLKWHYPIGLLYDMHAQTTAGGTDLPWALTLHVRKFPERHLIPSPTTQSMRDMFMATVKEADFIRNGSTKRVMDLAKSDQMQLLDGLESHSYEQYFAIRSILVPTPDPRAPVSSAMPRVQTPKAIPMRFYIRASAHVDSDGSPVQHGVRPGSSSYSLARQASERRAAVQFRVIQHPVPPTIEDRVCTLEDAFAMCCGPPDLEGGALSCCVCQGVRLPWDTPVVWMSDNLFYADCFLHIVVAPNP